MFGLLIGEFLVPIGTRGIVCIETLLVTVGGGVGLAILSPPLALLFKVSDMLSISSSSSNGYSVATQENCQRRKPRETRV